MNEQVYFQVNRLGHLSGGGLMGCYNIQHIMQYIFPQRCQSKKSILKPIRGKVLRKEINVFFKAMQKTYFFFSMWNKAKDSINEV